MYACGSSPVAYYHRKTIKNKNVLCLMLSLLAKVCNILSCSRLRGCQLILLCNVTKLRTNSGQQLSVIDWRNVANKHSCCWPLFVRFDGHQSKVHIQARLLPWQVKTLDSRYAVWCVQRSVRCNACYVCCVVRCVVCGVVRCVVCCVVRCVVCGLKPRGKPAAWCFLQSFDCGL
jgi:hypothetical protein